MHEDDDRVQAKCLNINYEGQLAETKKKKTEYKK